MDLATAQTIFENVRGTRFVGIDSLIIVPRLKRDEKVQPGVVTKKTTGSTVMVFAQATHSAYSDQVKRRMEKEGLDPDSWDSGPLPFGHWMGDSMFIEHTKAGDDKLTHYLRVHFVNVGKSEYFLDGKLIAKADIVDTSAPKKEGKQGGQDDKVTPRNYKLASIKAVRIDGAEFIV